MQEGPDIDLYMLSYSSQINADMSTHIYIDREI